MRCLLRLGSVDVEIEMSAVLLSVVLLSRMLLLYGCGSTLNHQGTADFSPCFHLPGFHFGYLFLTHSRITCFFGLLWVALLIIF